MHGYGTVGMLWIRCLFLFTSLFDGSVKYDVVAKKLTIAGISGYVFWCAINSVLQALGTQENRLVF